MPVAAAVEPVAAGLAAAGGDGAGAAERGEGLFGVQPVGVVAGGDQQGAGGVGPDAFEGQQVRGQGFGDAVHALLGLGVPGGEVLDALGQLAQRVAGGAEQGVVVSGDPEVGTGVQQFAVRQAAEALAERVGCEDQQGLELVDRLGAVLADPAQQEFRVRNASTCPSRVLAIAVAWPDRTARPAAIASMTSVLPCWRRVCRFGRVTSMTGTACERRCRVNAAP